jgi:hypothetical protein
MEFLVVEVKYIYFWPGGPPGRINVGVVQNARLRRLPEGSVSWEINTS